VTTGNLSRAHLRNALLGMEGMVYVTPNNQYGVMIENEEANVCTFGPGIEYMAGPFATSEIDTAKREALFRAYVPEYGFKALETAPKDDRMLRLFVLPNQDITAGNTSFDDSYDPYWTIGWQRTDELPNPNNHSETWNVCGWSWSQDTFCNAAAGFIIIGWKNFHN